MPVIGAVACIVTMFILMIMGEPGYAILPLGLMIAINGQKWKK
jgi:hypothetical protein